MLYGELDNRRGDNGYAFIDMVVRYSSSQDMFNELVGESWFEGEGFKEQSYTVVEQLKNIEMLGVKVFVSVYMSTMSNRESRQIIARVKAE